MPGPGGAQGRRSVFKLFKKSTKICHDCPVYCNHSQGGNTEKSPKNLRFPLLNMPGRHFPAGAAATAAHSRSIKKLFPVPCHGNRQRRRTDYQHPPDRPQLVRGFHTAGSTAFLLLSTVLPAFSFAGKEWHGTAQTGLRCSVLFCIMFNREGLCRCVHDARTKNAAEREGSSE